MDTPGRPDRGLVSTLYGGSASRINRRALIGCGLLLPLTAWAAVPAEDDLLARAMAAMGGRDKLARVKALGWTGAAVVETPDAPLRLGVETRVEPFVRARSRTWLADKPETARTLIVEPDSGFVERNGERRPLPDPQTLHERQQYAIYGYMLLALAPTRAEGRRLTAQRARLPSASFELGDGASLRAADYTVAKPEGGGTVAQRLVFTGEVIDKGIRWPRRIAIEQDGKSYFSLAIESFSVELA